MAATAAPTSSVPTTGAHFVAHALAILGRHLLPALAVCLTHTLPVLWGQLLPMFAHLVAHHASLLGLQLDQPLRLP
jgi:hypothetical protein